MAVVTIDGFDMYNGTGTNTGIQSKWIIAGGGAPAGGMIAGRFGGQAVRFNGSAANTLDKILPASTANVTVGVALRISNIPAGNPSQRGYIILKSGVNFQCGVAFDAAAIISANRLSGDLSGAQLAVSSPGVWSANTWMYVEIEFVISTTVGRITVYINGAQVLNITGVNTANLGVGTTVDTIHFGSLNGGNAPTSIDYDDLYVCDVATKLGERRIETLRPSADSTPLNWTPDTGTVHFSRVNATLAQATTFVQATTVGDLDLYDLGNLSSSPSVIDAVQYNVFAQKTDATTRAVAAVGDLSGVQQQSGNFNLAASVSKFESLALTKPGGGSWAAADVNALKIGPKVTV
jgi:hypothetical protein